MSRLYASQADGGSALQLYARQLDATPLLSAEQERALAERVAQGDPEAREHMVRANLRLVVAIARGYTGRGLDLEDLIAEGNLGLMRAVEGFDAAAGVRFSTYAAHWIKQSLRRAVINQGKLVRLPQYAHTLLAKWRRARAVLAERLGREPEPEEIGRALGLSKKKLAIALEAIRAQGMAQAAEDDDEGGATLERLAVEGSGASPAERLAAADDLDRILHQLGRLEAREAEIVRLRFGLGQGEALTLGQVGQRLGLTRERVRQLEKQALGRLAAEVAA
jgi:RNA polymerase primary sigma factor